MGKLKVIGASPRNLAALKRAMALPAGATTLGLPSPEIKYVPEDKKNKPLKYPFKLSIIKDQNNPDTPPLLGIEQGRVQVSDYTQNRAYVIFPEGKEISLTNIWQEGVYGVVLMISYDPNGGGTGDNRYFIPHVYFVNADIGTDQVPSTRGIFSTLIGVISIAPNPEGILLAKVENQRVIGDFNFDMNAMRHPFSVTACATGVTDGDFKNEWSLSDFSFYLKEGAIYVGQKLIPLPDQPVTINKEQSYIYAKLTKPEEGDPTFELEVSDKPLALVEGAIQRRYIAIVAWKPGSLGLIIDQLLHEYLMFADSDWGLMGSVDTYYEFVPPESPEAEAAAEGGAGGAEAANAMKVLRWKNEFVKPPIEKKNWSFVMENASHALELLTFEPQKAAKSLVLWDKTGLKPEINEPPAPDGGEENVCIGDPKSISWFSAKKLVEKYDAKVKVKDGDTAGFLSEKVSSKGQSLTISVNGGGAGGAPGGGGPAGGGGGNMTSNFEINPAYFKSEDESVIFTPSGEDASPASLDLSAPKVSVNDGDTPGFLIDKLKSPNESITIEAGDQAINLKINPAYFKSSNQSIKLTPSDKNLDLTVDIMKLLTSSNNSIIITDKNGVADLKINPAFFKSSDGSVQINGSDSGIDFKVECIKNITSKDGTVSISRPDKFTVDLSVDCIKEITSKDGSVTIKKNGKKIDLSALQVAVKEGGSPKYLGACFENSPSISVEVGDDILKFNVDPAWFISSDGSVQIAAAGDKLDFKTKGSGKVQCFSNDIPDYLSSKLMSQAQTILISYPNPPYFPEGFSAANLEVNFSLIKAKPPLKITDIPTGGIEISLDLPKGPGLLYVDGNGNLDIIPIGEGVAVGAADSGLTWVKPKPCEK